MIPARLAFVDLETTGADPERDGITEVGIVEVDGETVSHWSTLINPGRRIPPFIQGITGISDAMVADAPSFDAVAAEIDRRLQGRVFVAHNARFDYGFLRRAFQRTGRRFQADVLCTVRLSRRLFPEHHRHNLDSLIERHGLAAGGRHRALADADLIWQLWRKLVREIDAKHLAEAVGHQLVRPILPPQLPPDALDDLPDTAGAYAFYGEDGALLYTGRSTNLRHRVRSHFASSTREAHVRRVVGAIHRIVWQPAAGEFGARLLESRFAKARQPARSSDVDTICAWCLDEISPGDFRPRLVHGADADPGYRNDLHGLFSGRREANRALRKIAEAHDLCPFVLGLDPRRACVRDCAGACAGEASARSHGARLIAALARLKLDGWPYPGPVGIVERDHFLGREDVHVFDAWRHLGTARSASELEALLRAPIDTPFDPNIYRLLKAQLAKRNPQVRNLAAPGRGWHPL